MAHLQYMPGDPRLVDQLVYELKSKGIFDQFRKECIADVDTRPAYQNLRQRVESSVSLFLSRQTWKSDLNKNQLREKLRKHILDGNYLEQGVERIVDQVVNPKVAAVFMPQVEDLVYNYLGIPRKKTTKAETTEKATEELLPTDLEAVSPGSVKSNDGESKDSENKVQDMEIDSEGKTETSEDISMDQPKDIIVEVSSDSGSLDKSSIPLPTEEIKLENIPAPENSPKTTKVELENIELPQEMDKPDSVELKNIELPREPNPSTDIPLPDETNASKDSFFRPMVLHSEESNSSSSSSIRRNMSPLTPVRNFDDENSCDAQQAFENDTKENDHKEPSSFCFSIENKQSNDSSDVKEPKETEHLSYQFNNQVNINTYNTPMYDDSSNSHNLQIDYESDANTNTSKTTDIKQFVENSEDSKKERKEEKKSHKSSHKSRDSSRHSSSKDKHSSRDSSRHDKKSSAKDDKPKSSKDRDRSKDRSDKRDSSKHKSSHKSSSSNKDKHRSSSSSHRHSSKSSDEKKSASNNKSSDKDKERSSDKDKSSRDKKDSKSSHRDKDRKNSKKDDKDKKKEKKDTDDHYSSSGRGNHSRRSTDRDSNDGSSSSKGSQGQNNSKSTTESKKESKSNSKSDNISTSGESTSQSDKEHIVQNKISQFKPIVRVDNHLETPIANPPRLPFVPDVTLKKPKFANNFEEAKRMMKMRKFLAEEQKRMNQEAALLLEFQANVRPSLSQVYSSIPGPELEFACGTHNEIVSQQKSVVDHNEIVPHDETTVMPPNDIVSQQEAVVTRNDVVPEQKTVVIYNELAPQDETVVTHKEIVSQPETVVTHKEIVPQQETVVTHKEIVPQETVVQTRAVEPMKVEAFDTKVPVTNIPMVCSLHEPLEMKEITKDAKDIINDIIGVPVEEYREEHNDLIINELSVNSVTTDNEVMDTNVENKHINVANEINEPSQAKRSQDSLEESLAEIVHDDSTDFEITVPAETLSETDVSEILEMSDDKPKYPEKELQYFAEIEKFNAELERHKFSNFLNKFIESTNSKNKIYVVNCDTYEENIIKEIASKFGDYEVVNYFKNGHLVPNTNIVKDVSLTDEISLPLDTNDYDDKSPLFSPVKSECSFELSSDYDAKLDEIVNKKSRQEVMEIILGGVIDEPNKMPTIDYYTELSDTEDPMTVVEHVTETVEINDNLKRKVEEELVNKSVLTPNKIRKLSDSDQISSTTEEPEVSNNNKVQSVSRSKYLGRAKRVGLSRPKRCNLPNSPSSDKSVENYTQNTPTPPNGKLKPRPRSKVQRYDTSDLYKPKLHYLSRRNNIS